MKCINLFRSVFFHFSTKANNNVYLLMLTYYIKDMPEVEVGVNDITRMGLEVVGRHDILPVPTEQWIRYENIEFHPVVDRKEFEKPGDNHHIIKYVILLLQNIILQ